MASIVFTALYLGEMFTTKNCMTNQPIYHTKNITNSHTT